MNQEHNRIQKIRSKKMQESISFTQIREIKRELNHINKTKKEKEKKNREKESEHES